MFDTALTAHLAELSKLEFTGEELEKITKEMDDIVALMDTVSDFEATGDFRAVEPCGMDGLRQDAAVDSMDRQDILSNAKENGDTYFKVPKVV